MSNSTVIQTHYGNGSIMHHNNAQCPAKKHIHHSKRSGHNRITKGQKKRSIIANILFMLLSLIAIAIVATIVYDRWYGLF